MQALKGWYVTLNPDVLSKDVNSEMQALVLASGEIRLLPREQQLKIDLMVLKSRSNKKY